MKPFRICLVSSEVAPLAKTGGLADVAAGLSRYLGSAGHDVRVFMPLYKRIREGEEYTKSVEAYLAEHSEAKFSHGVCRDCYEKYVKPQLEKL